MAVPGVAIMSAGGLLARGIAGAGAMGALRTLASSVGVRAVHRGAGGWLIRRASMPGWLRQALNIAGLTALVDLFIPDDVIGQVAAAAQLPGQGGGDWQDSPYGAPTKTWETVNNGVRIRFASFALPTGGTMNGVIRKDGSKRYWRPKKPIVLTSSGASDLKTLIRADRVVDKQLRSVKKIIDRRFPARRRSPARRSGGGTTIIETGPGSVNT